ncbi:MAG: hypothetical protein ABI882_15645, partial [Acidobacteriota bacterium]
MKNPVTRKSSNASNTDWLVAAVALERQVATAGIVDARGRVLIETKAELTQLGVRPVALVIVKLLRELASTPEASRIWPGAIGVSVPGSVGPTDERVTVTKRTGDPATAMAWSGVDLREAIEAHLSLSEKAARKGGPILLISRAPASIAAEQWCGAARGAV